MDTVIKFPTHVLTKSYRAGMGKNKVFHKRNNMTGIRLPYYSSCVQVLNKEATQVVYASDWKGFLKQMVEKEQFYGNRDIGIEEATQCLIINMGSEHSDNDSDLESTNYESDDKDQNSCQCH